jgi:hypothetical protein
VSRSRQPGRWSIAVQGVEAGDVLYSLTCLECGGFEQARRGDGTNMDMVFCKSCGVWMGRLAMLNFKAARQAHDAGLEIDLRRYRPRAEPQ